VRYRPTCIDLRSTRHASPWNRQWRVLSREKAQGDNKKTSHVVGVSRCRAVASRAFVAVTHLRATPSF
jgi:hypothetical protein